MPVFQFAPEVDETMGVDSGTWFYVSPDYGSIRSTSTGDGRQITIRYKVPGIYAEFFEAQLKGYPFIYTDGSMRRHLPEPWREVLNGDGNFFIWCTHTSSEPFGGLGTLDPDDKLMGRPYRIYENVWVTATFETVTYDIAFYNDIVARGVPFSDSPEGFRYVKIETSDSVDIQTLERGNWVVGVPGLTADKLPDAGNKESIPLAKGKIIVTWFEVLPQCWNQARAISYQGTGNLTQFLQTFDEKTIILSSVIPTPVMGPNGMRTHNIRFEFDQKPYGVNNVYFKTATTADFYPLQDRTTSTIQPVKLNEFANLFEI